MERFCLVSSKQDKASSQMALSLAKDYDFRETGQVFQDTPVLGRREDIIVFSQKDVLRIDDLDSFFSPKAYIFLSRHYSQSGKPTITSHFPGNFSDDVSRGGKAGELAWTYPSLQKSFMHNLWSLRKEARPYDIVIESTHHGPTSLIKPVLFVEVGSTEKEWTDGRAISILCRALIASVDKFEVASRIGIGLGGLHYSEKFTKLLVDEDVALAAVISKHNLSYVTEGTVEQLCTKSTERVTEAYLDWKGLGTEKQRIVEILQRRSLRITKI